MRSYVHDGYVHDGTSGPCTPTGVHRLAKHL
jgi:hypothetical protein